MVKLEQGAEGGFIPIKWSFIVTTEQSIPGKFNLVK